MNIADLILLIRTYNNNEEELALIKKAYDYAALMHSGQLRQSGEPYIIHPLNVAYILADMHADTDTICAGLLHDTLEDTNATKEDITELFNSEIAKLVDGVTKISKMNFSSKKEQNLANARKIITSITEDVRIIIIKLADRLHNMRTLQYKSVPKQKENSKETRQIFIPLADCIGAYRIKSELEDICFRYIEPDFYKKYSEIMDKENEENTIIIAEVLHNIDDILCSSEVPHEIKVRTKNLYGIYKKCEIEKYKINEIHDLLSLKIMVDEVWNCYKTLGLIHSKYNPYNGSFKDYIWNPKVNLYRSIHTTIFGPRDKLIQNQIRTFEMDKVASFGLTAYWDIKGNNARYEMQNDLANKLQFSKTLKHIDNTYINNGDFINQVRKEVFCDNIYVYTPKGDFICLPKGSTIIDFAYKIHTDIGNTLVGAKINDEYISDLGYVLHNKDRVVVITDELSHPKKNWINKVKTTKAKKKIKEYKKK